jgi:hypothetical protein
MNTQRTVKLKNVRVANPSYSPRAAQHATTLAVVLFALVKLGIL